MTANNESILVDSDIISVFSPLARELLKIGFAPHSLYLPDVTSFHVKRFLEILTFGSTTLENTSDIKRVKEVADIFLVNMNCEKVQSSDLNLPDELVCDSIRPKEKTDTINNVGTELVDDILKEITDIPKDSDNLKDVYLHNVDVDTKEKYIDHSNDFSYIHERIYDKAYTYQDETGSINIFCLEMPKGKQMENENKKEIPIKVPVSQLIDMSRYDADNSETATYNHLSVEKLKESCSSHPYLFIWVLFRIQWK